MRRVHLFLIALCATATAQAVEPVAAAAAQHEPLTAAVLDFQVSGPEFEKKGAEAAVLLNAKLSSADDLILVERQELDKLLGEQELGLSGNVTPSTAAKVGNLTGAKALITGRIFGAGNKYFIVAKVIGTETSRVYGEVQGFNDLAGLDAAVNELAPKVIEVFQKHGDTLVAKTENEAEWLERLKKLTAGKKLPSVSVRVAEQHVNHAVADPAAQTELMLRLKQLGFNVVDAKDSAAQAEVSISGEAFSEFAGRRGSLVSCRARVELSVSQNSKLLLADRQTDVAVDLAENVAGKLALENAAKKLLERVVPVLTSVQ
jgi:hypothetical protein